MKGVKGSATVELAYMLPVIFLSFIATMYILFYFHDKNILIGAVYETGVVTAQKVRWDEENPEDTAQRLFRERTRRKFIFFSNAGVEVEVGKDMVKVNASAVRRRMKISTEQHFYITRPEKYIRKARRIYGS